MTAFAAIIGETYTGGARRSQRVVVGVTKKHVHWRKPNGIKITKCTHVGWATWIQNGLNPEKPKKKTARTGFAIGVLKDDHRTRHLIRQAGSNGDGELDPPFVPD